jgi:hypothetical protein
MSARPKAPSRRPGRVGDQPGSTDRNDSGVAVDDAHEDLTDDPPADRPQPVASVQDLGLLEDVEPQRRLLGPSVLGEADLRGAQRGHPEALRDGFA